MSAQNNPEASLPSYRPVLRAERRTSMSGNAPASSRGKASGWEQPRQRTGVAQRRRKLRQTLQIVQHDCLAADRQQLAGAQAARHAVHVDDVQAKEACQFLPRQF